MMAMLASAKLLARADGGDGLIKPFKSLSREYSAEK